MAEPAVLDPEPATKGERTRQRLVALAIARFGERGFRATSVSEIARSAGLTQAAVYAYFPNKDALFEAAVDTDAGGMLVEARRRADGVDVHSLVPTLLIILLGLLDDHPLVRRLLSGQERDQLVRLINLPALRELSEWMGSLVREAQQDGRARTDIDPTAYADGAETILIGLLMAVTQVGGSTEQRRQLGVLTVWDRLLRVPEP